VNNKFGGFEEKFNIMNDMASSLNGIKEHLGMKEAVQDEPSS